MAVILPAGMCTASECETLAATTAPVIREVTISPSRIDVVAQRATNLATTRNAHRG